MIHVTNYQRWNRTKGWVAFALFIGAVISVGGLEGEPTGNERYDIAFICISLCTGLFINITKRKM